jgi:hypothetical protein
MNVSLWLKLTDFKRHKSYIWTRSERSVRPCGSPLVRTDEWSATRFEAPVFITVNARHEHLPHRHQWLQV